MPGRAERSGPGGSFWTERLHARGHTGWADRFIYAYDQLERLGIVSLALARPEFRGVRTAIDFGCGTGDFSRLLLSRGYRTCGVDPFVEPAIASPDFHHARDIADIGFEPGSVDLLLIP